MNSLRKMLPNLFFVICTYEELTGHQTISTQFFAGRSLFEDNAVNQYQYFIVVQNL